MPEPKAKPMMRSGSNPMLRTTCGCTWPEPETSSQRPASGPLLEHQVDLGARLGEREVARPEAQLQLVVSKNACMKSR